MKLIILTTALMLGAVCGNNDNFRRIDSIRPENACSAEGGMCTVAEDCPHGRLTEKKNLCPMQRSQGIECCYGISVKETRCRQLGGECMDRCNEELTARKATDCPASKVCCILVN